MPVQGQVRGAGGGGAAPARRLLLVVVVVVALLSAAAPAPGPTSATAPSDSLARGRAGPAAAAAAAAAPGFCTRGCSASRWRAPSAQPASAAHQLPRAPPQARPDRLAAHLLPHPPLLQRQPLHRLPVRAAAAATTSRAAPLIGHHRHPCAPRQRCRMRPQPAALRRQPASPSPALPLSAGAACASTAASPTSSRGHPAATQSRCAASPASSSRALAASTSRPVGGLCFGWGVGLRRLLL